MFEQTIKNFNINFNASNERGTFSSGDEVAGHIAFELTKETKINSINMQLRGKAHVHWSTGGKNKRQISAKLDFFTLRSSIVPESSATDEPLKLRPGTHMFPFTCQIPHGDFPTSFHGVHGNITYNLTVAINRPWHLSKDFVTELKFVNHIDLNQPDLWSPLSGTNTMTLCCLWCASGPITMSVTAEKKAFAPGENVKMICDFVNSSSRTVTPKVNLIQKQEFYSHSKYSRRFISRNIASLTGAPISPHRSDVHTELMLPIPSSASFSITNCSILQVHYVIEVNLSVKTSPDLTVLIPIVLCDTSVNTQVPESF